MRTLALGCAADLMKADAAVQAAASSPDFLPTVLDALQVRSSMSFQAYLAHCMQARMPASLQKEKPAFR